MKKKFFILIISIIVIIIVCFLIIKNFRKEKEQIISYQDYIDIKKVEIKYYEQNKEILEESVFSGYIQNNGTLDFILSNFNLYDGDCTFHMKQKTEKILVKPKEKVEYNLTCYIIKPYNKKVRISFKIESLSSEIKMEIPVVSLEEKEEICKNKSFSERDNCLLDLSLIYNNIKKDALVICKKITDESYKNFCLAIDYNNSEYCEKMQPSNLKNSCRRIFLMKQFKESCYNDLNAKKECDPFKLPNPCSEGMHCSTINCKCVNNTPTCITAHDGMCVIDRPIGSTPCPYGDDGSPFKYCNCPSEYIDAPEFNDCEVGKCCIRNS